MHQDDEPNLATRTFRRRHESGGVGDGATAPAWQRRARRVSDSQQFVTVVLTVIVLNAVVLGLETYSTVRQHAGSLLEQANRAMLWFFVAELVVRLAAVGFRPDRFFRRGWNVFDFIVVAASFIPGLQANTTALRLVRLLRVARLLSFLPDIHVLFDGMRRAVRPAASLLALTTLLVYLYAVVGWSLFAQEDPDHWGNVGEAAITLFQLLTLEGWNEILDVARDASPFGLVYILSFILVGTFVVLNLVIGVVITSLDEAYSSRRRRDEGAQVAEAADRVRDALGDLERAVALQRAEDQERVPSGAPAARS